MPARGGPLLVAALLTAIASTQTVSADDAPVAVQPAVAEVGLAVGQQAPAFSLKDQNNRTVSLDSLLQNGPVAVVFFRSADWCTYCKMQLIELQKSLPEIQAAGGQLVGISYDSDETLRRFIRRSAISFPLLSDTDSQTIDAYDIRNKKVPADFAGVSFHGTFVLDRKGVIRSKLFQVSYAERPALDNLIAALKAAR